MASCAQNNKIMLRSPDGKTFTVDEVVAAEFQTIKHMIELECADGVIPLSNVSNQILSKVIEYCEKHVEATANKEGVTPKISDYDLMNWDHEFVQVDKKTISDLS